MAGAEGMAEETGAEKGVEETGAEATKNTVRNEGSGNEALSAPVLMVAGDPSPATCSRAKIPVAQETCHPATILVK